MDYISTDFGVDSSIRFLLEREQTGTRTDRPTDRHKVIDATDHYAHASLYLRRG